MKSFIFVLAALITSHGAYAVADECDTARIARMAVQSLIAIEDTKGVTAIAGGGTESAQGISALLVDVYFGSTMDTYEVSIREKDCRIFHLELLSEKKPLH